MTTFLILIVSLSHIIICRPGFFVSISIIQILKVLKYSDGQLKFFRNTQTEQSKIVPDRILFIHLPQYIV